MFKVLTGPSFARFTVKKLNNNKKTCNWLACACISILTDRYLIKQQVQGCFNTVISAWETQFSCQENSLTLRNLP